MLDFGDAGGLGSLAALPLRLLPWFKRRRVTDTYLSDPHVTGYQLPAPEAAEPELQR